MTDLSPARLCLDGLSKIYPAPSGPVVALRQISLTLNGGESLAIQGPSGSGKSTLLAILGALEPPTAGTVHLDRVNPYTLSADDQARFRNQKIGFVFQDHQLLPQCTALENVLLPSLAGNGLSLAEPEKRALELLEGMGLLDRAHFFPHQLSGGERQRVAIARALLPGPSLLLADEPTGNLDTAYAERIGALLLESHRREKNILMVVTHNERFAALFQKQCRLLDGCLTSG